MELHEKYDLLVKWSSGSMLATMHIILRGFTVTEPWKPKLTSSLDLVLMRSCLTGLQVWVVNAVYKVPYRNFFQDCALKCYAFREEEVVPWVTAMKYLIMAWLLGLLNPLSTPGHILCYAMFAMNIAIYWQTPLTYSAVKWCNTLTTKYQVKSLL